MRIRPAILTIAALAFAAPAAYSEEIVVNMLNRSEAGSMVFEPAFVQAHVGDTIRFVPVDKGHNAETIKGFIPEGAEPMIGANGEEVVLTLTEEGLYGIRCKPHYGLGMVALIAADAPVNLDAARALKLPKKAKQKFEALLGQL